LFGESGGVERDLYQWWKRNHVECIWMAQSWLSHRRGTW